MKSFKFKYRGMKLTAREKSSDETISPKTLMIHHDYINTNDLSKVRGWTASGCLGERVGDHPTFKYIEVLSTFYQGETE